MDSMILSTRADPPRYLNLPKSPRPNPSFKQFLLNSPLPSPALPAILPRHGKKPPRLNTKKTLRLLCWLTILTVIFWIVQTAPKVAHGIRVWIDWSSKCKVHRIIPSPNDMPKLASSIEVTDDQGQAHWTVSIPSNLHFPLSASAYDHICLQAEEVSIQVASSRNNLQKVQNLPFHQPDPNYVEIEEAQRTGLLPAKFRLPSSPNARPVCKKSLTYILDATEAGLGDTLLGLWLSYGLAKREGRAFFIDYSNFAYGKFTSLFSQLPPNPDCRPPPWEQRTPCPNHASHLVVGTSTLKWTFGLSFQKEYGTKDIFSMAREGYDDLFNLKKDDEEYIEARIAEQRKGVGEDGLLVGIHIRRGDRHPFEFQYQHGYIPPIQYMAAAHEITKNHPKSIIMLASDDADMYHHPELKGTVRAQDKIKLASKKHMQKGGLGWEGGFFKDAFWDIGLPEHVLKQKYVGSPEPTRKKQHKTQTGTVDHRRNYKSQPTEEALQLREYLGRAYMLDLAVLAGSDEIVCGVSSRGCRIIAVMMGWDKLHHGHWRNIDGDYGWQASF